MRTVQVQQFGGPEVLVPADAADPAAGSGEVVIDVSAANVMFLDTQLRSGWGQDYFAMNPPYVPGSGVAGRVAAVGQGVDPSWIGTEVIAETGDRDPETGRFVRPTGGYAERAVVRGGDLVRVPQGLDGQQALGLLNDGPNALLITEVARFQPNDWVLITAAAGGAANLLVQLAHAAGARVLGAARGEEKLELARELGAEAVVDYSEPGWSDRVIQLTEGNGAPVVVDGAGGELGHTAFGVTTNGGRFISYGASSGEIVEIAPEEAEQRGVSVSGLFDLPNPGEEEKKELVKQVLDQAVAGRLRPVIGQTFKLEQASEAHTAFAERRLRGKTLLLT